MRERMVRYSACCLVLGFPLLSAPSFDQLIAPFCRRFEGRIHWDRLALPCPNHTALKCTATPDSGLSSERSPDVSLELERPQVLRSA